MRTRHFSLIARAFFNCPNDTDVADIVIRQSEYTTAVLL